MGKRINKLAFGYYFILGGDDISIHYVNLAYEISISKIQLNDMPKEQHNSYKWFCKEELSNSNEVHKYVKDYFNTIGEK